MKLLFWRLSNMKHLLRRLFRMATAASAKASTVVSQLFDARRLGGDARVPKGHVAVCVNEEGGPVERQPASRSVGRPTFAAQEYGYGYPGALHIPCPVTDFHDLLLQLSSASTCAAADHPDDDDAALCY
ncbi:auxin-responsive protein SAUR71-like [Miscanthus floridulus]|uniref:auxin-responsive protein SAUR71-like n=1 Tax=Miscanthus floridulus TaxID=154761 RepID=UPI003458B898